MIEQIKSFGFDVYARPKENGKPITDCFFTDGLRIGYIQWGIFLPSLSSVHKPNTYHGSGISIVRHYSGDIYKAFLTRAFIGAPECTDHCFKCGCRGTSSYKNFNEFLNADSWNQQLVKQ